MGVVHQHYLHHRLHVLVYGTNPVKLIIHVFVACTVDGSGETHTNNRYLTSPHKKEKLNNLQNWASYAEKEVQRLQNKISVGIERGDVSIDE